MSEKYLEPVDDAFKPFLDSLQKLSDFLDRMLWDAEQRCKADKPHALISSTNRCKHYS